MINIYINNQLADYFGDLTIKKDSPYFMPFDKEPASHTYTLTLPSTATNVKIFSLIQYSFNSPSQLNARIDIDGVEILNGTCRVQSWDESGYSVYFTAVTPYSDSIGESSIKRLYADKRSLREVFANYERWNNIYSGATRAEILWNAPNLITGADDYDAIAKGWAFVPYLRATADSFGISSSSNIWGFSVGTLLYLIQEMYRINIIAPPQELADVYISSVNSSNKANVNTSQYVANLLPNITAINFLQGLSAMCGCRLRHNYTTDELFFDIIEDHFNEYSMHIETNNMQVQWGDADLMKAVKYADAPSLEREYESTEMGVEVKKKDLFPMSAPLSSIINSAGDKDYIIPFSIPQPSEFGIDYSIGVVGGSILTSVGSINKIDDYSIICGFDFDLEINNQYGWFTPPPYTFTDQDEFDYKFAPLRQVAKKKVAVKFSAKLNPLEFNRLNDYPSLFVPNVGRVHIKTITFKSSGESDIEACLY